MDFIHEQDGAHPAPAVLLRLVEGGADLLDAGGDRREPLHLRLAVVGNQFCQRGLAGAGGPQRIMEWQCPARIAFRRGLSGPRICCWPMYCSRVCGLIRAASGRKSEEKSRDKLLICIDLASDRSSMTPGQTITPVTAGSSALVVQLDPLRDLEDKFVALEHRFAVEAAQGELAPLALGLFTSKRLMLF
ncbi:hypothetical protein DA11_07730 [Aeromonas caviae]|nr:hypothetical protein DA11_07730 [Aeromonas caviae]